MNILLYVSQTIIFGCTAVLMRIALAMGDRPASTKISMEMCNKQLYLN